MANEAHYFYVLYCQDNTLYGGYTNDLAKRLQVHQSGKGAKYTRVKSRQPVQLIYAERWSTKQKAMSQEYYFKKQSREQKEAYLKKAGILNVKESSFILVNCQEEVDESAEELS